MGEIGTKKWAGLARACWALGISKIQPLSHPRVPPAPRMTSRHFWLHPQAQIQPSVAGSEPM